MINQGYLPGGILNFDNNTHFKLLQDILIAAFGFIFFLSIGAKVIAWCSSDAAKLVLTGSCKSKGLALGSLTIISSFLYLADTAFGGFAVIKS